MTQAEQTLVTGKDGLSGVIVRWVAAEASGERQALVRFDTNQQVLVPASALVEQQDGTYRVAVSRADLARYGESQEVVGNAEIVLPVIEEELEVRKRTVATGGVRVSKLVREREEVVEEPLLREQVSVERVPINRVVEGDVAVRREGDVLVIPVLEEVLVIEKRVMLKEELRVILQRTTVTEPQRVTLRSEEVVVEQIDAQDQLPDAGTNRA